MNKRIVSRDLVYSAGSKQFTGEISQVARAMEPFPYHVDVISEKTGTAVTFDYETIRWRPQMWHENPEVEAYVYKGKAPDGVEIRLVLIND